ncbi:MAG TPA: hypothetical protein DCK76_01890 [Desulfotomaculum sp.]|nr:MAG: Putative cyclase [Desulfotomaculum sp. 46_296]HAG10152.1 hypothetical protein [Desulfotomaculum sp.]HBY03657.1 hypothetical protein [Desulfotomaculum sp.]
MKLEYLSHALQKNIPVYGKGMETIDFHILSSVSHGDSSSTCKFTMGNHWGTHIDCPAHFFKEGKRVSEYSPETWIFKNPYVLEITLMENEIITPEYIGAVPKQSDLILIKSSFGNYRGTDKYSFHNPEFSPETGFLLRKKYPSVRAVGFDFISASPYQNRELGRETHRAFLGPNGDGSPVLFIEDMDLSKDLAGPHCVYAVPLLLEEADSSPCTVIGEFK